MSTELTPFEYGRTLGPFAFAFAVGLVLMGYAGMTYWQAAYMAVNPAIGSLSNSTAGVLFHIGLFVAGAMMAFTAGMAALYKILIETNV